jgi:hypothetical protein
MSSSLMPSYLNPDIFVNNISSTLYREHLENLYFTCKSMHKQLYKSGGYSYKNSISKLRNENEKLRKSVLLDFRIHSY